MSLKLSCSRSNNAGCLHEACKACDTNTLTWLYLILSAAPNQPNANRSLCRLAGMPPLASFENRRRTQHFGISVNLWTFSTWRICLQGRPLRTILLQLQLTTSFKFLGLYST